MVKNSPDTVRIKTAITQSVISSFSKASIFAALDIIKNLDVDDVEADRFVYVARESVSGRYKIGISKNPEARVKQLNTGNPEKLILVHAYLATEQKNISEKLAHSLFDTSRLKGEWFESTINMCLLPSFHGHVDEDANCNCVDCNEYRAALNAAYGAADAYEAVNLVIKNTGLDYARAKKHVDAMVDTGVI